MDDIRIEQMVVTKEQFEKLMRSNIAVLEQEWLRLEMAIAAKGDVNGKEIMAMGNCLLAAIKAVPVNHFPVSSLLCGILKLYMSNPMELDQRCGEALLALVPEVAKIMQKAMVKDPDLPANGMGEALVEELMKGGH